MVYAFCFFIEKSTLLFEVNTSKDAGWLRSSCENKSIFSFYTNLINFSSSASLIADSIMLSKIFSKIGFFDQIGFCDVFDNEFYYYLKKVFTSMTVYFLILKNKVSF